MPAREGRHCCFYQYEAVLKFVDKNIMSYFRGYPVLLFEKDSDGYED